MSGGSASGEDEGHIPNPRARFLSRGRTPLQKPHPFGLPRTAGFFAAAGTPMYELPVWEKDVYLDAWASRGSSRPTLNTRFALFHATIHEPLVSNFPQHA